MRAKKTTNQLQKVSGMTSGTSYSERRQFGSPDDAEGLSTIQAGIADLLGRGVEEVSGKRTNKCSDNKIRT